MSIWTICAGETPLDELSPFARGLHDRWEMGNDAPLERKVEDINSCQLLRASYRHFSIPDCIYRRNPQTGEYMYVSEQALNGSLHPGDAPLIERLHKELQLLLPHDTALVCPLALGDHVDHQLVRLVAETLACQLWYYADYPYVLRSNVELEKLGREGWAGHIFPISTAGLAAWQDSIAAHDSQISTFWRDETEMRRAVSDYWNNDDGIRLWRKPA